MGENARLLIVDDHPLLRDALGMAALVAMPRLIIDAAGSIAEAEELARVHRSYRLALLDLVMPDVQGFSGLLRLQRALGSVPILIVSGREEPELVARARDLGAAGFISKMQSREALIAALGRALDGESCFPALPEPVPAREATQGAARLSSAQLRVMLALASGHSNKQIAIDLGVSEATVKAHVSASFRKLGVYNRAQALLALQPLLVH